MQKLVWKLNDREIDLTSGDFGITEWNGFSSADLNIQSQQVPFQDGSVFLDALISERELSVTLAMNDNGDLEIRYRLRRELIAGLNPKLGEGYLIYTNDFMSKRIKCIAKLPLFPTKNSNTRGTPKASLSWTACSPYWEDLEETEVGLNYVKETMIYNEGDVPATMELELLLKNAKSVEITNNENSLLKLENQAGLPNKININTGVGQKSVTEFTGFDSEYLFGIAPRKIGIANDTYYMSGKFGLLYSYDQKKWNNCSYSGGNIARSVSPVYFLNKYVTCINNYLCESTNGINWTNIVGLVSLIGSDFDSFGISLYVINNELYISLSNQYGRFYFGKTSDLESFTQITYSSNVANTPVFYEEESHTFVYASGHYGDEVANHGLTIYRSTDYGTSWNQFTISYTIIGTYAYRYPTEVFYVNDKYYVSVYNANGNIHLVYSSNLTDWTPITFTQNFFDISNVLYENGITFLLTTGSSHFGNNPTAGTLILYSYNGTSDWQQINLNSVLSVLKIKGEYNLYGSNQFLVAKSKNLFFWEQYNLITTSSNMSIYQNCFHNGNYIFNVFSSNQSANTQYLMQSKDLKSFEKIKTLENSANNYFEFHYFDGVCLLTEASSRRVVITDDFQNYLEFTGYRYLRDPFYCEKLNVYVVQLRNENNTTTVIILNKNFSVKEIITLDAYYVCLNGNDSVYLYVTNTDNLKRTVDFHTFETLSSSTIGTIKQCVYNDYFKCLYLVNSENKVFYKKDNVELQLYSGNLSSLYWILETGTNYVIFADYRDSLPSSLEVYLNNNYFKTVTFTNYVQGVYFDKDFKFFVIKINNQNTVVTYDFETFYSLSIDVSSVLRKISDNEFYMAGSIIIKERFKFENSISNLKELKNFVLENGKNEFKIDSDAEDLICYITYRQKYLGV